VSSRYNHKIAEKKWQKKWIEKNIFCSEKSAKKEKYYVLEMFPLSFWKNSYGAR